MESQRGHDMGGINGGYRGYSFDYCLQDGDDIYIFCSVIGNNCFPVFKTHEHFDNVLPNVTATQNYGLVNT